MKSPSPGIFDLVHFSVNKYLDVFNSKFPSQSVEDIASFILVGGTPRDIRYLNLSKCGPPVKPVFGSRGIPSVCIASTVLTKEDSDIIGPNEFINNLIDNLNNQSKLWIVSGFQQREPSVISCDKKAHTSLNALKSRLVCVDFNHPPHETVDSLDEDSV